MSTTARWGRHAPSSSVAAAAVDGDAGAEPAVDVSGELDHAGQHRLVEHQQHPGGARRGPGRAQAGREFVRRNGGRLLGHIVQDTAPTSPMARPVTSGPRGASSSTAAASLRGRSPAARRGPPPGPPLPGRPRTRPRGPERRRRDGTACRPRRGAARLPSAAAARTGAARGRRPPRGITDGGPPAPPAAAPPRGAAGATRPGRRYWGDCSRRAAACVLARSRPGGPSPRVAGLTLVHGTRHRPHRDRGVGARLRGAPGGPRVRRGAGSASTTARATTACWAPPRRRSTARPRRRRACGRRSATAHGTGGRSELRCPARPAPPATRPRRPPAGGGTTGERRERRLIRPGGRSLLRLGRRDLLPTPLQGAARPVDRCAAQPSKGVPAAGVGGEQAPRRRR